MKNFEDFVNHIVAKWRAENKVISEKVGLGMAVPNRIAGDLAEKFISKKIDNLTPNYTPYFANGSQTPSDIYSISRRHGYWHIMLIQVKSSLVKNEIEELSKVKINKFSDLAKFIKSEISESEILKEYKTKPIIITTGYAGVLSIDVNKKYQHRLIKTRTYNIFKLNSSKLDLVEIKSKLLLTHKLGLK